jgi:hypothetical protein
MAQLISLTVNCIYPDECVPLLRQTSNLIQCELELFCSWDNSAQLPDIRLPSLKSLTMTNPSAEPVTGYLTIDHLDRPCSPQSPNTGTMPSAESHWFSDVVYL